MSGVKIQERRAKGLYWDRAWKLVEGCTKVSPGCDNCWSETETAMRARHPNTKINMRAGRVLDAPTCSGFDGTITCREDNLDLPLRTKKPTVFAIWNDLFHEDVPSGFLFQAYKNMLLCTHHTFLVLTKRPEKMAEWTNAIEPHAGLIMADHIYHGVTVCNQDEADRNIPYLLQVPGKRFLSIEPMLGPIDLVKTGFLGCDCHPAGECLGFCSWYKNASNPSERIHQVLLGAESGKNARPMNPDWPRKVRDDCASAGVPFMFKQWGEWCSVGLLHFRGECKYLDVTGVEIDDENYSFGRGKEPVRVGRVGKKKAGRTLDGQIHDELIWDGVA